MPQTIEELKQSLLEVVYPTPKICLLCNETLPAPGCCQNCRNRIERYKKESGQCTRCGTFSVHGIYCPACYHWPEGYIKNTAPLPYQTEAEELIAQFKYLYQGHLAKPLSLLIFQELSKNPTLLTDTLSAIVVPIPMSPARKRQKGYNHAEVLSKEVAGILSAEHLPDLLLRPHHTPHQVGLGNQKRRQNLKNAFHINKHWVQYIANKTILLVDDVLTTSATLQEAASTLLAGGVQKVFSVTIAAGNPEVSKNREKDDKPWK